MSPGARRASPTADRIQYAFLLGTSLVCLRIAYDPELASHSPGTIALKAAIEDAVLRGARRVELLGHQEPYKLRLANAFEPMSWGTAGRRRGAGRSPAAERSMLRVRIALRERVRAAG